MLKCWNSLVGLIFFICTLCQKSISSEKIFFTSTLESFGIFLNTLEGIFKQVVAAAYLHLQLMTLLEPGGVWYCFIVFSYNLITDMSQVMNYINDKTWRMPNKNFKVIWVSIGVEKRHNVTIVTYHETIINTLPFIHLVQWLANTRSL